MEKKYTILAAFGVMSINDNLVMIKRPRFPYPRLWSLPGGIVEKGQHPTYTAAHKAEKETGYTVELPKEPSDFIGHYAFSIEGDSYQAAVYSLNVIENPKYPKKHVRLFDCSFVFAGQNELEEIVAQTKNKNAKNKVAKPIIPVLRDLKLIREKAEV